MAGHLAPLNPRVFIYKIKGLDYTLLPITHPPIHPITHQHILNTSRPRPEQGAANITWKKLTNIVGKLDKE